MVQPQRMNNAQMCALAGVLSMLVFYLTRSMTTCSEVEGPAFLGVPLKPAPEKLHVLVTGGAGFIGSHAAKRLLADGHAVTVVDNLSRGNMGSIVALKSIAQSGRFQFVQADLGQRATIRDMFRNCRFDLVMHFAAIAYVGESMVEPLMYYRNITANTVNVLDAMQASHVKQLVFSSTCATYGNPAELPVTEATPTAPINPYGRAKLMSEDIIRDYARADPSLTAIVFRYFNVYGSDPEGLLGELPRPELRRHGRISGACLDAALGEVDSLSITGTSHPTRDGTCVRDFIHVADLVGAHVLGMRHLANPPALYNVGTGKGVTVREFVDACKRVTGAAIVVKEQREARPGDYAEVWADPSKIQRDLGWTAQYTDLDESLRHAWTWRKSNAHGYAHHSLHKKVIQAALQT